MEFLRIFRELIDSLLRLQGEDGETLRREGGRLIAVTIFAGIVNAVLVALIIASARQASVVPNNAAELPNHPYGTFENFSSTYLALVGLCLAAFALSRRFVLMQSAKITERIVSVIRIRIADKIRRAHLLRFEQANKFEIDSALKQSTAIISASAPFIANGASAALMLISATGYVAVLSRFAFLLTTTCIVAGVSIYALNRKHFRLAMRRAEKVEEQFFNSLTELLDGFKEVKMHAGRNQDLYENYLVRAAQEAEEVKRSTSRLHARVAVVSQTLVYVLLTVIIFILPAYSPQDASKISPIAAVILFIVGPLSELVAAVPISLESHAAVLRISMLEAYLDNSGGTATPIPIDPGIQRRSFETIALENILFFYDKTAPRDAFRLEVPHVHVQSGEILFLVGGNGSGKSTFLKLLTGLYEPDQGDILIDGQPLTRLTLGEYRSLFSTVFADFHLFDRIYGLPAEALVTLRGLLEEMQISRLVSVNAEGRFVNAQGPESDKITVKLSTGQKKRLALAVARAENRPILVLDEFAADQDPEFRAKFYKTILPELRTQGRTIIAATHDDHYFGQADRILRMDFGRFEDITRQYHEPA